MGDIMVKTYADKFGEIILEARKVSNMQVSELAEISGVSKSTIARFENGRAVVLNLGMVSSICKALNLSMPEVLLQITESEKGSSVKLYRYVLDGNGFREEVLDAHLYEGYYSYPNSGKSGFNVVIKVEMVDDSVVRMVEDNVMACYYTQPSIGCARDVFREYIRSTALPNVKDKLVAIRKDIAMYNEYEKFLAKV